MRAFSLLTLFALIFSPPIALGQTVTSKGYGGTGSSIGHVENRVLLLEQSTTAITAQMNRAISSNTEAIEKNAKTIETLRSEVKRLAALLGSAGVLVPNSPECPVYMPPQCGPGEVLVAGSPDASGCISAPTCRKKTVERDCPLYMPPQCRSGEVLVGGAAGKDGCVGPAKCVSKIGASQCPDYAVPECEKGFVVAPGKAGPNGCLLAPSCIAKDQLGSSSAIDSDAWLLNRR
ncbi:hypothetical protein [Stappia sp. P2PMeth1]|uniref:hypothetical protein n=1 Tax=Stappia sp. P2PMeth1 TaxID=2003586 RepID=UPI001644CC1B|nr:hypothetical protein [Stappia sp. P2PMeth1]